jgi:hypothetical protein
VFSKPIAEGTLTLVNLIASPVNLGRMQKAPQVIGRTHNSLGPLGRVVLGNQSPPLIRAITLCVARGVTSQQATKYERTQPPLAN